MSGVTVPFYNIWIRTLDTTPLYSRYDVTQSRGTGFNPPPGGPTAATPAPLRDPTPLATVLPRGFIYTALITSYEKLEFKTRYNNTGGWTLLMQDNTDEANQLKSYCYGNAQFSSYINQGGYAGITVIRNGKIIFSGSVRGFEATGDFYAEKGPMVEFYGVDDTAFLETRLAMTPAPGNQIVPRLGNDPYGNNYYSGRQIPGNQDAVNPPPAVPTRPNNYSGTFVPPINQGWGYYTYPVPGQNRTVAAGLRNIVQLNASVYAPYPYTYPFTMVVPGGALFGPTRTLYNIGPGDGGTNFALTYTPRRIPFLFMGVASSPRNAYTNLADSSGQENPPGVPNFSMRARYETLLEKCQEIASYTEEPLNFQNLPPGGYRGYQFSINQDTIQVTETLASGMDVVSPINGLRFNYKQPAQKENEVIFSQSLGNLGSYKYSFQQQTANYVIAAGQGESTLRWFMRQASADTRYGMTSDQFQFGLREKFIDRRDVQYGDVGPPNNLPVANIPPFVPSPPRAPAGTPGPGGQAQNYGLMVEELQNAIDVVRREEGSILNLELNILDVQSTRYFVDYFVGDWVTVRLGSANVVGQITDVTISITKDAGEVISAVVGTQVIGDNFLVFEALRQNKSDITRLEISQ